MSVDPGTLILRADASRGVGFGHTTRLLALGHAWGASGGNAIFATLNPSKAIRILAAEAGVAVSEMPAAHPDPSDLLTLRRLASSGHCKPWVAVDGYGFGTEYLSGLREAGCRVLFVDDLCRLDHFPVDVLLNQNAGAEKRDYRLSEATLPLLGSRWAMLRPGFASSSVRQIRSAGTHILVSFGGSDPANATRFALRALRLMSHPFDAIVALGPGNDQFDELERVATGLPVRFERQAQMPTLMAWADVALIGGGVTMLEACASGLPSLVIPIAENQKAGAVALAERRAVRLLGSLGSIPEASLAQSLDELLSNEAARAELSSRGPAACDGDGALRVVAVMTALTSDRLSEQQIAIRLANFADSMEVWRIANEHSIRANSFTVKPIPLNDHLKWFRRQLSDQNCRLWLIEAGGAIAGQVRFVKLDGAAEVHYSVRAAFRGRGLGTMALRLSSRLAFKELRVQRLFGVVITPNVPSENSFRSAGWRIAGTQTRNGKRCAVFEADATD